MATRAKRLIYQGKEGVRQGDYFMNVPARDLEEADIVELTDEQYADVTSEHPTLGPLYLAEESARSENVAEKPASKSEGKAVKDAA